MTSVLQWGSTLLSWCQIYNTWNWVLWRRNSCWRFQNAWSCCHHRNKDSSLARFRILWNLWWKCFFSFIRRSFVWLFMWLWICFLLFYHSVFYVTDWILSIKYHVWNENLDLPGLSFYRHKGSRHFHRCLLHCWSTPSCPPSGSSLSRIHHPHSPGFKKWNNEHLSCEKKTVLYTAIRKSCEVSTTPGHPPDDSPSQSRSSVCCRQGPSSPPGWLQRMTHWWTSGAWWEGAWWTEPPPTNTKKQKRSIETKFHQLHGGMAFEKTLLKVYKPRSRSRVLQSVNMWSTIRNVIWVISMWWVMKETT